MPTNFTHLRRVKNMIEEQKKQEQIALLAQLHQQQQQQQQLQEAAHKLAPNTNQSRRCSQSVILCAANLPPQITISSAPFGNKNYILHITTLCYLYFIMRLITENSVGWNLFSGRRKSEFRPKEFVFRQTEFSI